MQHIIPTSYVVIDTESGRQLWNDTKHKKKQWDLANKLVEELKTIGMQDALIDDKSYIMATLPSNVDHEVPTIGFIYTLTHLPLWSEQTANHPQLWW
jgi:tripeptide aminopeptidase